jgi:hypothetical protein
MSGSKRPTWGPKGERKHALLTWLAWSPAQGIVGHCRWAGETAACGGGAPEKGAEWDPISRDERIECSPFPAWYYNHQHRTLQSQHRAAESAHMAPTCRSGGGGASGNMPPSPGWRGHQRRALQAQHRAADQVRRPHMAPVCRSGAGVKLLVSG